jgi:LPXTG-motif cell wall-anchored protein
MAGADWNIRNKWIVRAALCTFSCAMLCSGVRAQDTSTTTTHKAASTYETQMKSGTVVYVSGNNLVVKGADGEVKHLVIPEGQTFDVDGKQLTVHQLTPGTHLTRTITTTTTPTTIKTVRTIEGKVWHVNAPNTVILTLPDGTNKQYNIPKGQMFTIDGQQQSAFHLKKGMNVSATVVTEEPVTHVSQNQAVTGVGPQMPDKVDVLLVESPTQPAQPTQAAAAAEPAPAALPKTGSEWPLVGLLGFGSLGAGMLTRRIRMALK